MSQTASTGTAPAATSPATGVAFLRGRIKSMRRANRAGAAGVATVLALPAPDAYSHPSVVEVWSTRSLGEKDTDVAVKVQIGGYGRSYQATREDDYGDSRKVTVQTADNTLTVIEA